MRKPSICASIISPDLKDVEAIAPAVDLFEVRIDLIGDGWREVAGELKRPWIACNRRAEEGGNWRGSEEARIAELLTALDLGASIIDIELATANLEKIVPLVKRRAKCLLSCHDLEETPSPDRMHRTVHRQLNAGADICKLVTTAQSFEDNLAVLQLISDFPRTKVVAFAMGPQGYASRILCPLAGGYFVYASVAAGKEAAPGQITVGDLQRIYGMVKA
jgi:3-dehydroquinate dehydratase type I